MSRSSSGSSAASSAEVKVARASRSLFKLAGISVYQCGDPGCRTAEAVLRLCGNCRQIAYCSAGCQNNHWSEHKIPCKKKNPSHFDKDSFDQIQWLVDVTHSKTEVNGTDYLTFLIDCFRLRCVDEKDNADIWPKPEDVMLKFLRFLHAAKGVGVLPKEFTKVDYISARYDAISRYKLPQVRKEKAMEEIQKRYSSNVITDLRSLHNAICGPIISNGTQHPNII